MPLQVERMAETRDLILIEGNAAALTRQKNADSVQNVIAMDGGYGFGVALVRKPVIANREENYVVRAGQALRRAGPGG